MHFYVKHPKAFHLDWIQAIKLWYYYYY